MKFRTGMGHVLDRRVPSSCTQAYSSRDACPKHKCFFAKIECSIALGEWLMQRLSSKRDRLSWLCSLLRRRGWNQQNSDNHKELHVVEQIASYFNMQAFNLSRGSYDGERCMCALTLAGRTSFRRLPGLTSSTSCSSPVAQKLIWSLHISFSNFVIH